MATMVRVTLNDDVERLLKELKQEYPALDYAEILKLALGEYYRQHKRRLWRDWADSLPALELSDEDKDSLARARREKGKVMSVEKIMAEARA